MLIQMDYLFVSNTAIKLRGAKVLTNELFVELMVQSLGCRMRVSAFQLDSQDNINDVDFWEELKYLTFGDMNVSEYRKDFAEVIRSFEKIFDATKNKENAFIRWREITSFLSQLPEKCSKDIFLIFAAAVSVKLLAKFMKVKNFKDNVNIERSMLSCLKCVSEVAEAISTGALYNRKKSIYDESVYIIDEFLDLAATDGIFLADSFEDITSKILENATKEADSRTTLKYYNAIVSMMKSKENEVRTKMFQHCMKLNVQNRMFHMVVTMKNTRELKVMALHIQRDLLKFSRRHNLEFQRDWDNLLSHTFSSKDNVIKKASKELFLLEVNGYDDPLERGIQIFRTKCDDSHIGDFVDMLKIKEDSESCNKLFQLLNDHIADTRMCAVIILIMNAVADDLSKDLSKYDQLVQLMKDIFAYIPIVQSNPNLVYRLMNIINIDQFKCDATFRDNFLEAENHVLNAFYDSENYGTAVGLLEILNRIGFDDEKLYQMFEELLQKQNTTMNNKTVFYLFMAAADTFNIFEKVHHADKFTNFCWFKKCFENATDPEIKSCWITLIVNLLVSYTLVSNIPDMDTIFIQVEALSLCEYLDSEIVREGQSQFTYMNLSTAFCVLNSTFTLNVKEVTLEKVFYELDEKSYPFKQRFLVDSREDGEYDLRLVQKFWSCLITLYAKNQNLKGIPWSLFEYFNRAEIHLKPYVEAFVLQILNYGSPRYKLFSEAVRDCIAWTTPVAEIKASIKNLFDFVRSSNYAFYISPIALQVFLRVINIVPKNSRPATVKAVQNYLYTNYLTQQDRDFALSVINDRISKTGPTDDEKQCYKMLLEHIQKSNECSNTAPATQSGNINPPVETFGDTTGTNRPSSSRTSVTFTRRSTSLAGFNLTFPLTTDSLMLE